MTANLTPCPSCGWSPVQVAHVGGHRWDGGEPGVTRVAAPAGSAARVEMDEGEK